MHNQLLQACLTLGPYGLQPTSLFCPWDFPGNSIGGDCHALFQGIFLTLGLNPQSLALQVDSLPSEPPEEAQYAALKVSHWVVSNSFVIPCTVAQQALLSM